MNSLRRLGSIALFLTILYLLYDLSFQGSSTNQIVVQNTADRNLKASHWLILDSPSEIEEYLKSPIQNLSIIVNRGQSYYGELKRKQITFLDVRAEQTKHAFHSNNPKTVAYLLAIFHGARFIYEYHPNISLVTDVQHMAFRRSRSPFVNILATFTANFSRFSPGIPEQEWVGINQDGWSSIRTLDEDQIHPMIQQQIRIYRNQEKPFVNHPPVALEPMTFAPIFTKDILFTYDAFWGLVLPQSKSPIWRSWWVQRLLSDLQGHVIYASSYHDTDCVDGKKRDNDRKEDVAVSNLVRFLSTWKSEKTTLVERIEQLFVDMKEKEFISKGEIEMMSNWLKDLKSIGYQFPKIKSINPEQKSPPTVRRRRTAVCLTGIIECIEQAWRPTAQAIRSHIQGEMDIFMYLSSTEPVVDQLSTVAQRTRLIEALRYENFTVKVLFENIPKLDPQFPPNCTSDKSVDQPEHKIPRYYQQLFGLANCFALVRDYEKKHNIKYDLMVRTRADIEFLQIPPTFERPGPVNINTTTILPPNRYSSLVDDGFAIGPIDQIEVYMNRYFSFRQCITRDLHPERYLYFYLRYRQVPLTIDQNTVVAHIPHGKGYCH